MAPSLAPSPRLASRGDCEGLRAWWQAGADLGRPGYDGRSALLIVSATSTPAALSKATSSRKVPLTVPPLHLPCPSPNTHLLSWWIGFT